MVVVGLIFWGVATEGEEVADPSEGVGFQDGKDFFFGVADAGEVGDGVEGGFGFDSFDECVREFAGGAARAVGDAHEGGLERFELSDGFEEGGLRFLGFGWEELEGKGGFSGFKDIGDVHKWGWIMGLGRCERCGFCEAGEDFFFS